jgi:hypothetical protein
MTETVEWYAWEILTSSEANAWFLMMCVFAITCITFIITNMNIRDDIHDIKKYFNIKAKDEYKESWIDRIRDIIGV